MPSGPDTRLTACVLTRPRGAAFREENNEMWQAPFEFEWQTFATRRIQIISKSRNLCDVTVIRKPLFPHRHMITNDRLGRHFLTACQGLTPFSVLSLSGVPHLFYLVFSITNPVPRIGRIL